MNSSANATNNYRRLRRLAWMCSEASHAAGLEARYQLARIIERLAREDFESYSDLLLLTMVEEKAGINVTELKALAQALESESPEDSRLREIGELGNLLYQETAQALARLRSG